MNIKTIRNGIIFLYIVLVLSVFSGCSKEEVVVNNVDVYTNESKDEQMILVNENEEQEFYFDPKTTYIQIKNKHNGYTWYSNPPEVKNDKIANKSNKELMQSTFVITYNNERGQVYTMDNYKESISKKQFNYELIEEGIRVNYTLGEAGKKFLLPRIISEKRMNEKILDNLNKSEQSTIKRNYKLIDIEKITKDNEKKEYIAKYPSVEQEPTYVLRDFDMPDYMLKKIQTILDKVNYTEEDLEKDEESLAKENEVKKIFNVSIEYKLKDDGLQVTIPSEGIKYPSTIPITDIALLQYFGASNTDEGYMFVPDGSGALINYNNNKIYAQQYSAKVYGFDEGITRTEKISNTTPVRLPVFGSADKEAGFIGVIEKGDSFGRIEADIAGRTNSYNHIGVSFNTLPNDTMNFSGTYIKVYQNKRYEGDYQIKYMFLDKDESNYVGMAKRYRSYLLDNEMIKPQEKKDILLLTELIGSIESTKSFLGIPYNGKVVLTPYADALNIIDKLKCAGVNNIALQYNGINGKGIDQPINVNVKAGNNMGGQSELDKLYEYANANDVDLYVESGLAKVKNNRVTDGFIISKDACRKIDRNVAELREFSPVYFLEDDDEKSYYLLKPSKYSQILNSRTKNSAIKSGIALKDIGDSLYSDFNEKETINRQQALEYQIDALKSIDEQGDKIIVKGANVYALPYASIIANIPLQSNNYKIIDETVPFYQIVLHGYVSYTGQPMNLADDYTDNLLKTIETGADLQYIWMTRNNDYLVESMYDQYYSVDYKNWIMDAVNLYKDINDKLSDVVSQPIINHENLGKGINRTTYENGIKVVVNYTDRVIEVDDVKIKPKSYHVFGKDKK